MKNLSANLIEQMKQVKDFRVKDGQRHPLWLVLLFVIMGTMSGLGWIPRLGRICATASSSIN